MKKILLSLALLGVFFLGIPVAGAREPGEITDWYIQNFNSTIELNKDSSLLITEFITADCGTLPDKHGIFRILPTKISVKGNTVWTPVELISITDFEGNPYEYETIKDFGAVTYKIGSADTVVSGVNRYKIVYKVKNAIRDLSPEFDEFYWNLLGTYWQIDIDIFSTKIIFPSEVNKNDTKIDYYTGVWGSKGKDLAGYMWVRHDALLFASTGPIKAGEGITASVAFPKGIFTLHRPSYWEKNANYFTFLLYLIPFLFFVYAFLAWWKIGKDPKIKGSIPPEFGIPEKITPTQMGMVFRGRWADKLITATIIDLAVRKFINIKEISEKVLFVKTTDYELKKGENYKNVETLTDAENILIKRLFKDGDSVRLADLKNKFFPAVQSMKKSATKDVQEKWLVKTSYIWSAGFIFSGFGIIFISFWLLPLSEFLLTALDFAWMDLLPINLFSSAVLSGIILILFGIIMPRRTQEGSDLLFKIKGFELYMRKAEDYRQQFYEKENIFDKFLPYAIVFGIADLWVKKMQKIYGEEYFKNYHPAWFTGASMANFNANSFTRQLNSITSTISSNTSRSSSSSGFGGSGSSGGGGGGGGGGGW